MSKKSFYNVNVTYGQGNKYQFYVNVAYKQEK